MDDIRFRVLGPMEIEVQGAAVALPGTAERALLVQLLLSAGRTIPATTLVDRLWSESSLPVDPVNALQVRVSRLRRALAKIGVPDIVTRAGVGYRAGVPPTAIDAVDFTHRLREARSDVAAQGPERRQEHLEAYDAALALWRGEALADFNTEQWATAEAARLTELRLAALTERAGIALGLRLYSEVAGDLEPLVAQDPTLESLVGLLMVALYRSGRQADALEAYSRTRVHLDEELGLEPSASLRSLHARVLRQDVSLGGQPDPADPPTVVPNLPRPARGAGPVRGNLPAVLRPLIGRDEQLDAVCALVADARLVCLVGPGGAGKTALAVATAVRSAEAFSDGAFAVRLSSVKVPRDVPLAVADALGVPLDGAAAERDVRERLVTFLATRHLLLLVDNCEHVVDAAALLIDQILSRCRSVTVLATSREALAVPDEVQVSVGPLDAPPEDIDAGRVLDFPASQLFVERARAVRPGTILGVQDLLAVGRITRALDGIPLALELAAARISAMSPQEISARLEHRFALLTSGARTAETRQQTLRATVDWSYALLTEHEQRVFDRLAIFHGGFTLDAAEAVVGDDAMSTGQVLDIVGRLVDRSMLVAEPGALTRYRMLETLRQYAAERLSADGDDVRLATRHARYYRDIARQGELALRGHGQREALARLRAEQANIRAALDHLEGPDGDLDSALVLAGSMGLYWHLGRHLEGREVLGRLLSSGEGSPSARALSLQAVSLVERPRACLVHPSPRCAETARESMAILDELGDVTGAAWSRVLLAVEGVTGDAGREAESLLREAELEFDRHADHWGRAVIGFVRMETALKSGDEGTAVNIGQATAAAFRRLDDPWGLSAVLYHLGWGLRQFGRYEEAARVLEEAIDVAASAGLYNTVQWALADLGLTHVHLADQEAASDAFRRARDASQHVGDGAGATLAAYGHGLLAKVRGDWAEARRLFTEAEDGFALLGTPVPRGLAAAGLARCDEVRGEIASARRRYEELLATGVAVGEPGLTATAYEGLARLASARGDAMDAERQLAEAALLRERARRPAPPHERLDLVGVGAAAGGR